MKRTFCTALFAVFLSLNIRGEESPAALSIQEAVTSALENSASLKQMKYSYVTAVRKSGEQWRSFLPDLTVSYSGSDAVPQSGPDAREKALMLGIGYGISAGMDSFREREILKLERGIIIARTRALEKSIIRETILACLQIIRIRGEISINRALIENYESRKKITESALRVGRATRLDLLSIEASAGEALYRLRQSENALASALRGLSLYTGLPVPQDYAPDESILEAGPVPASMNAESLYAGALELRPEMAIARLETGKAALYKKISDSYYMPRVYISGAYGLSGEAFPPASPFWNAGFTISTKILGNSLSAGGGAGEAGTGTLKNNESSAGLGLYDSPGWLGDKLEASAEYFRARGALRELRASIKFEIEKALDDCRSASESIETAGTNMRLACERIEIESGKTALGRSKIGDLLDLYGEKAAAELMLLTARIERKTACMNLEKASGLSMEENADAEADGK